MKSKILAMLRDRQGYVSGQELCETFGVSRTAVWKAINKLKSEGFLIEAVPNKGYILKENTDEHFGQNEIASRLETETKWVGHPLYFFREVDSTNTRAKLAAEEGEVQGALFVADMQTAGRGRRGRTWDSPAGSNIYYTLLLRPAIRPDRASMMTLLTAMAVVEAVKDLLAKCGKVDRQQEIGIKWPNDVVADGRKLCGILTEMSAEFDAIHYVVIGTGINAKHQEFPKELADTAITVEDFAQTEINRSELLACILKHFEEIYETFLQTEDMQGLMERYNAMVVNKDREVRVLDPKGEYEGIARGINREGELLVEKKNGETVAVFAGEVSVRGIYGYV